MAKERLGPQVVSRVLLFYYCLKILWMYAPPFLKSPPSLFPQASAFCHCPGELVSSSAQDGLVCQAKVVVSHQGQS